jgi:sugar phosphate isomerase/epimerase
MNRRLFLQTASTGLAALSLPTSLMGQQSAPRTELKRKQGVTRMVFPKAMSFEDCCRISADLGVTGFDFADAPEMWPVLKKYGLVGSMYRVDPPPALGADPGAFRQGPKGWNAIGLKEAQEIYLPRMLEGIDTAKANGFPNMILAAGGRMGTPSSEEGLDNAVAFCNALKKKAEDSGVTLCVEYLNSKGLAAPRGSFFDHMSWGVDLCKRVDSPSVKILYDIYHAQLMEGDICDTISANIQYIAHIHTGGVPGRHQLDENQELNYRFIAQTIAAKGFTGFITHEWTPAQGEDPVDVLRKSLAVMDV